MFLGEARTPTAMRLYAIGDVHGRDDLLAAAHERIRADLAASPPGDYRIVHLGDYIDRGPASAAVIERLAALGRADPRVVSLCGNHDAMMQAFLVDPVAAGEQWFANRAADTLASYGVASPAVVTSYRQFVELGEALAAALPTAHRTFLDALPRSVRFGDYFFCHAGIRPGVPLDVQDPDDLIWIREPFLTSRADHGAVVIHGHTPVPMPDVRPNRINIDTGAVFNGLLTTLVLEGTGYRFL